MANDGTDREPEQLTGLRAELQRDAALVAVVEEAGLSDEVIFMALAKMSPAEYSRVRRGEAKRLGIGVTALDQEVKFRRSPRPGTSEEPGQGRTPFLCDPVLWPGEVDGAALIQELAEVFERHLTLPEGAAPVLALWLFSPTLTTASRFRHCWPLHRQIRAVAKVPCSCFSAHW